METRSSLFYMEQLRLLIPGGRRAELLNPPGITDATVVRVLCTVAILSR